MKERDFVCTRDYHSDGCLEKFETVIFGEESVEFIKSSEN